MTCTCSFFSTALLFAVTGVLAPYLEETVFRGFLMTSLTKWYIFYSSYSIVSFNLFYLYVFKNNACLLYRMPIPAAVALSAGAFALAHFTPGEIPQLFALGKTFWLSLSHGLIELPISV